MNENNTRDASALPAPVQVVLSRHHAHIEQALRRGVMRICETALASGENHLQSYYGQMLYHLGWVDANFTPTRSNPGKLLRPTLLLLAYEAAGAPAAGATPTIAASLRQALPAAAAIELTHNFTLIHDDIEDGDTERRHRPTLWKLWGVPQAINTGDGLFALSRLVLWDVVDEGVDGAIAARLGAALDLACLTISEGQYLDMSFERRLTITVAQYVDMISRKTAAILACAAQMGAMLATRDAETIQRLRSFGQAIGIAFQVRDDQLGVWASSAELGKTVAGDLYRRKKSLPILHALEHADLVDQQTLRAIYQQTDPVSAPQVEQILAIFARTETRAYCHAFLAEQCRLAREALANVPHQDNPISARAIEDMQALIDFVEA